MDRSPGADAPKLVHRIHALFAGTNVGRITRSPDLSGFDPKFYLEQNPDVRAHRKGPLDHFLRHGWREGRDPSPFFSIKGYLSANPDVAQANENPLLHYLRTGMVEGREGWNIRSRKGDAPPVTSPGSRSSDPRLATGRRATRII